ncbi:MAG TPA: metallophosphoesterase [Thermoplasmatales archaeon]|nr:metallophosphoesterase [Thermoplasmatales archaeon]
MEADQQELWPGWLATSERCLYVPGEETVVVADLHLGYEGVLRLEGVAMPRYQGDRIMQRLQRILDRYRPRRVVVNGDFKHEFGKNLQMEWREVGAALDFLSRRAEVVLVRGNHDNFLKTIAARFEVPVVEEHRMGEVTIAHGHRPVAGEGRVLLAHEHPVVRLRDEVGALLTLPCYLYDREVAVMPAFSPLASGTDVSTAEREDLLSPLLRSRGLDSLRVVAVSGLGLLDFSTVAGLSRASHRR